MKTRNFANHPGRCLLTVLLLFAGFASAQTQNPTAQQAPACDGLDTTAAMLNCEGTRYQQLNRQMQNVYAQLQKKLSPAAKNGLALSQGAWIKFRDSSAAFEASLEQGGTLAPLLQITAKADLTQQRVEQLRKLSDSQGAR